MLQILAAVILNHVRRVLVPWLGQFIWWHAVENMKFARSSPHYFLESSSSFTWREVLFWMTGILAVSLSRKAVWRTLVKMEAVTHDETDESLKQRRNKPGNEDVKLGICTILYLAMSLTKMEMRYTQTSFSAAYIYGILRLVMYGSAAEKAFLYNCLYERWLHATFQCCLVLYWAYRCFLPTTGQVISATAAGQPAMGVFHCIIWGGTAYLVRYSNKYFILLELSDMLVTFGWMVLGVSLLLSLKMEVYLQQRSAKRKKS